MYGSKRILHDDDKWHGERQVGQDGREDANSRCESLSHASVGSNEGFLRPYGDMGDIPVSRETQKGLP